MVSSGPTSVADNSTLLPPLILGGATFNIQYVSEPNSVPIAAILERAFSLGVNAIDTSPYYGPSEELIGLALKQLHTPHSQGAEGALGTSTALQRENYQLITKCGRLNSNTFDYSADWVRYSVHRSLRRLNTHYLDVVFVHDVEFVWHQKSGGGGDANSKSGVDQVLEAVNELRRLQSLGLIRHVGVSGYPPDVLCAVANEVMARTGRPLDIIQIYAHFTAQNVTLASPASGNSSDALAPEAPVERLRRAGVRYVLSSSMLGLGLLTTRGIDYAPMREWHPAPKELKAAMKKVVEIVKQDSSGMSMEEVALRFAMGEWSRKGQQVGTKRGLVDKDNNAYGISIMGITSLEELEQTVQLWHEAVTPADPEAVQKQKDVVNLVEKKLWPAMGKWKDYEWDSPEPGFTNNRKPGEMGAVPRDDGIVAGYEETEAQASRKRELVSTQK